MTALTCWIPGQPIPQGRARTGGGHHHMAPESRAWRALAVVHMRSALALSGLRTLDVLCATDVLVVVPRPQRRPELVPAAVWAMGDRCPAGNCADVDNYAKAVLDAAQDAGWLTRDHLVAELRARKVYSAVGKGPGLEVTMVPLW